MAKKLDIALILHEQKGSKTENISTNIPADMENTSPKDEGLRELMQCFSHAKTSAICTEYNSNYDGFNWVCAKSSAL